MGRAARTKTSKAAVKHTLKHARSPAGLGVGIAALGRPAAALGQFVGSPRAETIPKRLPK